MATSAEVYSWREGELLVWTGSATPAAVARLNSTQAQFLYGWQTTGPSLSGTYTDHLTGQAATVSIAGGYTFDAEMIRVFQAVTGVHMEIRQSGINGSAGFLLYSGRIDSYALQGGNDNLIGFSMSYHANQWSAYGG